MSNRILAIDFETANHDSDSACAIGLVCIEGNQIVEQHHFLIKPPSREFVFTYVHGITWSDVMNEPTFEELWPRIEPLFEGVDTIVAHNVRFDQRVLQACCSRYGIPLRNFNYACTVALARKTWGIYPTNLPAVCRALDIPLQHHNAISDALACARILIQSNSATVSA